MIELTDPAAVFYQSWLEAKNEWPDAHHDGAGMGPGRRPESVEEFVTWVERSKAEADPSARLQPDRVRASRYFITENGKYLGAVELRHELTPLMAEAVGHIGYSVRPTARGRGVATAALHDALLRAHGLGMRQVLLTCDPQNIASARTIEKNGGVLEDVRSTRIGMKRRYWIDLSLVTDDAERDTSRARTRGGAS